MTKNELIAMVDKHNEYVKSSDSTWFGICDSVENCREELYRACEVGTITEAEYWKLDELLKVGF